MTLHPSLSTPFKAPLSLTKLACVMLALCVWPTLANAQTIINTSDLTDTFGDSSFTGRLKNPSMNVNWRNPDNAGLSTRFDSTRYHATFATASLRYNGNFGNTISDYIVWAEFGFVF